MSVQYFIANQQKSNILLPDNVATAAIYLKEKAYLININVELKNSILPGESFSIQRISSGEFLYAYGVPFAYGNEEY